MKHFAKRLSLNFFFLALFTTFLSLVTVAQTDQGASSTTSTTKTTTSVTHNNSWYTSPWVWVVGAAVFILLLVALLSNRGSATSDTVRVTKTIERDKG